MCDVVYFLVFKLSDCVIYLKVNKHIFKRFIYLFIRERAWGGEGQREERHSQADFPLNTEPDMGLDLRTLTPGPELKS